MKTPTLWLVLAAAALPACTVNYYGVGPGAPERGPRHGRGSWQVRSQDGGQAGAPGPAGTPGQPGAPGANGGGYPPPRPPMGGGTRYPNGPGTAGTGPTRNTPSPVQPTSGSGGIRPPRTTGTSGSASTPPVVIVGGIKGPATNEPVQAGGIKTPPPTKQAPVDAPVIATTGNSRADEPAQPLGQTGGIRGPRPTKMAPVDPVADPSPIKQQPRADEPAEQPHPMGGIRGPRPTKMAPVDPEPGPDRPVGGIKDEPAELPTGRTGGIKPSRPTKMAPVDPEPSGPAPVRIIKTDETPGDAAAGVPALVFSKAPCRGYCPSYTATVWPDGRVLYNGQGNVPHLGLTRLNVPAATVQQWLQQAQEAGFADLREHYASGNSDIPATTLTIYQPNGKSKTVVVEDDAPAPVLALYGYLDAELNRAVGGDAKPAAEEK